MDLDPQGAARKHEIVNYFIINHVGHGLDIQGSYIWDAHLADVEVVSDSCNNPENALFN